MLNRLASHICFGWSWDQELDQALALELGAQERPGWPPTRVFGHAFMIDESPYTHIFNFTIPLLGTYFRSVHHTHPYFFRVRLGGIVHSILRCTPQKAKSR